jgi:repressor LexA
MAQGPRRKVQGRETSWLTAKRASLREPCVFYQEKPERARESDKSGGIIMSQEVTAYRGKKGRPFIDWEWMGSEVEPEFVEIPILGTVAAGQPIEPLPYPQTVSIPKHVVGRFRTYALRVEGRSMVGENIQHGDHIIIEAKETAENGETVVAMINNEEVTLKRFYIEPDHIRLQPANPGMQPIILHNHEIRILGVVCAVMRKYRYH